MRHYPLYQVDAFTDRPLTGNAAGVVLDADDLSSGEMQAIAREMNLSETVFVLAPDGPDHDCRLRFFTPTVEVPSCGHATIAAHFTRAVTLRLNPGRIWHKIGLGRLPIDIALVEGRYRIMMTQGKPVVAPSLALPARDRLLAALGLDPVDLDPRCPVQWVSTGHPKILVGIRSRALLDGLAPDMRALVALADDVPNGGYFIFCLNDPDPDVRSHARMFAPNIGIPEDPVTGNGNGPLGAYLVHNKLIDATRPTVCFRGRQGEAIGRPGTAFVEVDIVDGRPAEVRVGGGGVIVFEAELKL